MKSTSILACVAPLAIATRNAAELKYALPKGLAAESSSCEFPANYTINNFMAAGTVAGNFTDISELAFSFEDTESGFSTTCALNETSTNLSPGGAFAEYACDSPLLTFFFGNTSATGTSYKITVSEVICKYVQQFLSAQPLMLHLLHRRLTPARSSTYEVSGSWIPDLACSGCASSEGVECRLSDNLTSYTGRFSSLDPIID